MQVNGAFIGVILLLSILVYFVVRGFGVLELFANPNPNKKEGFVSGSGNISDIILTTCPADSTSFINDNGRTICCNGMILDNKCSGKTLCTLSESAEGIPTCNEWYSAWLNERGKERCPASMPNYFEDKSKNVRGCCAGPRNKTGTAPLTPTDKMCKIYTTQKEENEKEDSCTNMKLLESTKCFSSNIDVKKTISNGVVSCSYTTKEGPIKVSRTCLVNPTKEWKDFVNSKRPDLKNTVCAIQERLYIRKDLSEKDAQKIIL